MAEEAQDPERKALIVFWDPTNNEVDYDAQGLSVFDVCGILSVALELAAEQLPSVRYASSDADDD